MAVGLPTIFTKDPVVQYIVGGGDIVKGSYRRNIYDGGVIPNRITSGCAI